MSRTVRPLQRAELDTLLDWAAMEGWNPGLHDGDAFWAADPTGFFGAFVGDTMVAGIAAVAYDKHYGFIGLYICHPDWRGQCHGKAVWDAAMNYLGTRTIGLDGVPEQQANYARMGFVPAYKTVHMSGTLGNSSPIETIAPSQPDPQIAMQDRHCFPASRAAYLSQWLSPPNTLVTHADRGKLTAYAVRRRCVDGHKLGPLFAEDLLSAMSIITSQAERIHLDVPEYQDEFLSELKALGFTQSFATSRMYRGRAPLIRLASVFGITSLELG